MVTMTDKLGKNWTADRERSDVERVYRMIRDWMITSELCPGVFLSEPDLAERCGTSRTPVREALSRLVQDGWVNSIHRKGFQVRPITLKDISDIFTYRRLFERYAGERAAATATTEQIARLESILDMEDRPGNSITKMADLNEKFHMAIADRTENERIIGQMHLIMAYMRRLDSFIPVVDQVSHREILEAIKRQDGARASSLLGEHVDFALGIVLRSFLPMAGTA